MSIVSLEPLATYLLAAMAGWSPPSSQPEGADVALARYREIARDIARIALDPAESPVFPDPGKEGRASSMLVPTSDESRIQTALLLTSIASLESGFRADVDTGKERGGRGIAWCLMQVQVWGHTEEGWTGRDLVEDRSKCLAAGLHLVRESFTQCHQLPVRDRLSAYTVGTCRAEPKAEWRTLRATLWFKRHPFSDADSGASPQHPDAAVRALADG